MLCAILKVRLWEFQNGKMGKNSSKIDQDTAKTVKRKILKNNSFCLKVVFFLTKFRENCYFSKGGVSWLGHGVQVVMTLEIY